MSTYIKTMINPKTGKKQKGVCFDDFYGPHEYGYGFKTDGSDFTVDDFETMITTCEFYRQEELVTNRQKW
jgi:hypothetical protein